MPKDFDFNAEAEALFKMKKINLYMAKYLLGLAKAGLNEELWDEALADATLASELGVNSEEEFMSFFYIDHFVEDLVDEIFGVKLKEEEEDNLKRYMFSIRDDVDYGNLLTYRVAVLKWLQKEKDLSKQSYPNVGHVYKALPKYNHARWHSLLAQVGKSLEFGVKENVAVLKASEELEAPENLDFLAWYKFYRTENHNKYDVNPVIQSYDYLQRGAEMKNKTAEAMSYMPSGFRAREESPQSPVRHVFDPAREHKAQDFDSARNKLISRTFSIDKLLERYRKVMDLDQLDAVEDALNTLRKKIRKLRMAATVRDSMIKTANICARYNFTEGAKQLLALAEGELEDAPKAPPVDKREAGLAQAVEMLGFISQQLKNRDLVRAIAEADLLLHELQISSFFPELTDAQAKLIDSFGYASNKIDDMLPKLRGGLFNIQQEQQKVQQEKLAPEPPPEAEEPAAPKAAPKAAPLPPPVPEEEGTLEEQLPAAIEEEGPVAEAPVPIR